MKLITSLLKWMLIFVIFFTLFAFALNNEHDVTVHFFFGHQWTAPLVLVVLISIASGFCVGVLGMVPRWWKHRRDAYKARVALRTQSAQSGLENSAIPSPPVHGL